MKISSGEVTQAGTNTSTPLRFVTGSSLFDGHDAAINMIRRLLQSQGAEVVHLGHNRSVQELVDAAIDEDADGLAVSSYQGGHNEFFKYTVDELRRRGAGHIQVFGGGGGVILPAEIDELQAYGVNRIYSPQDGQKMGLEGMIGDMIARAAEHRAKRAAPSVAFTPEGLCKLAGSWPTLTQVITQLERGSFSEPALLALRDLAKQSKTPVLGITGTGGAGKSSLTDELIRRLRMDHGDELNIAVVCVDPSRRKTGGALLGDRIRMNAIGPWQTTTGEAPKARVFMRSLATRDSAQEVPATLPDIIALCRATGFDLVMVETPGIGQGDAAIVPHVDFSLYVMTPEYGAASQLEKIDMLDFADLVAVNKFDRKGALDALRDVCKQVQRNRMAFTSMPDTMPVYGTLASRFNDDGVSALYKALRALLPIEKPARGLFNHIDTKHSTTLKSLVPSDRVRYLSDIASTIRGYKKQVARDVSALFDLESLQRAQQLLIAAKPDKDKAVDALGDLVTTASNQLSPMAKQAMQQYQAIAAGYAGDVLTYEVRGKALQAPLTATTLCGLKVNRVSLPRFTSQADLLRFVMLENLPGYFPYTAGVFPVKREGEDPTRMFAGEGDPARTNKRFKMLSATSQAKRLSTAFDSVTLYGFDPDLRPDIYGKVGTSGVSVATLDDMKVLYSGFDLCAPSTSVSMTINGPAPTILAMFLNTAIDQQVDKFTAEHKRAPSADEYAHIKANTLKAVRGTVQADILKEDQGQNTCIFSTEFSLRVMGDIQQYFIDHEIRNFYSVSISGYHIAEAGANPISQLAFTLSNGFTFVEAYLARGMQIDEFAPNLSFFFSNGMDPEYTVLGRVARRIWAVAMRERYGASERSQKLKYHIQTSGRSLHAQEISFNDIRTTLQALIAVYDNCNSLHTNAYDEAVTTPTEESVRRAMAIQLIINKEWGLAKNENPNQGSFVIEELTELVEEAVLSELERISERGGVLGAMETGYQRSKIQEESMHYEIQKHDGTLPIIGVNTFLNPHEDVEALNALELARATEEEKQSQLKRLADFQQRHADAAGPMLKRLQHTAMEGGNVFDVLVDAVRVCSLGQITRALFEVGGQYRRSM
ncbi:methylmalonyl-CoA mutase family protein [Limnobacter humi]|uniref:Fused isobutyryl-CoA mutase n=1 Tax=Limnobacter humi TaxID=1778671 RepID=A0ABT1WD76_9BURK|nr:fused isobutyryl-CoA mutase/GTPase IcmF [Limnobacter humi]MCQ8895474.1 methylmalonyl-CoA mutase family protein [Limnobacter humi]